MPAVDAVAECRRAHRRLLETLASLDDETARRASHLPGWSVGHVVTHLARNADSFEHLFRAAAGGAVADQYPGGMAQRDGDIAAGAGRRAADLVADLEAASGRLEAAWDACSPEVWAVGRGRAASGSEVPLTEVPFRRWREVEVHHVDLGLGFGFDDWPPAYVRTELDRQVMRWRGSHAMGLTELPAAALALPPPRRLAWLLGRLDVPGLDPPGPWS